MSVIYRWIFAVGGATVLMAGLFAAMPHVLRLNSPEAGEELAAAIPPLQPTQSIDYDLNAESPCWGSSLVWCDYYWALRNGRAEGSDSYRATLDYLWQQEVERDNGDTFPPRLTRKSDSLR